MMWNRARWWPPETRSRPDTAAWTFFRVGFHARQGEARAGQNVLVLTGPDQTQTYLESTEAISSHGIAPGSRQYGQAGV
jgi:hypothetical protein